MVGMRRFELPTPSSRTKCATRLRYIPIMIYGLFVPDVAVDAFAGERLVGHVSFNFLGAALGTLDFFLVHFGDFHLDDKIFLAFFTAMVVMGHGNFS